jgi:hypothetical protein
MDCLVLQTRSSAPDAEVLKTALRSVKRLTDADAIRSCRDAFGVLARDLSAEEAHSVQRALAEAGVPTTVLPANQLPRLPEAKYVRRMEPTADALVIYDPLGRPLAIPWAQLAFISAGAVRHFKLGETVTENWVRHYSPVTGTTTRLETDVRHRVDDRVCHLLDLLLGGPVARFEIEMEHFLFGHVMDRPGLDPGGKLAALVALLAQHAPHAVLNRGAAALAADPPGTVTYASKAAFAEETTWLAWRALAG